MQKKLFLYIIFPAKKPRAYDENVRLVRQTIHDINKNRPEDGGIMLCLDNAKASTGYSTHSYLRY